MSENKQKKRGLELYRETLEEAKKTKARIEEREARDPEYRKSQEKMREKIRIGMKMFCPEHLSDE